MPKVPAYKRGISLVKGEPDRKLIKPTTIDRAKYQSFLDKPLNTGDNFVTSDPNSFVPEVMATQGFNYHSGTVKGKDLLYKKGNNYYLYNEQPGDGGASNYGLVNIGDMSEPKVQPAPVTTTVAPKVMPIDPMKQEGFNGMLKNQTIQYKNGGKVKGYFGGGDVEYDNGMPTDASLSPSPNVPTTSEYQSAITAAQQKNLDKQKKFKLSADTSKAIGATALTAGNEMYQRGYGPSANQTDEANYDKAVTGVDTAAASLTPWYGMAKGASNIAKSQIKRDEFGQPTTKVGSVANDWLTPDHELIMQGYKQDGLKGALRESSGLGKIGRTVSTLTGNAGDTTGIWGKVNKLTGQADKNKSSAADAAIKQAELDAQVDEEAKRKNYINDARISEAMAARDAGDTKYKSTALSSMYKPTAFADGGMVKGKGGPKSDSIDAKVEAGSFIVPAENAHIAKELATKVLRKAPSAKAKLNQGGGVEVKLSNGEYQLSPEEKSELESYGYNIDALAPNAKDDLINHLKCGGDVKGYAAGGGVKDGVSDLDILEIASSGNGYESLSAKDKKRVDDLKKRKINGDRKVPMYKNGGGVDGGNDDFEKKELAKIEAQRKADAARLGEIQAKQKAEAAKRALSADIRKRLEMQYYAKKQAKDNIDKNQNEYNALKKSYDNYSKESDFELNRPLSTGERYTKSAKPTTEEVRKNKEDLLNKLQESKSKLEAAQKDYNYASNEGNFITPETGGAKAPKVSRSNSTGGLNYLQGDKPTTEPLFNPSPLNPNIQSAAPVARKAPSVGGKKGVSKEVLTADVLPKSSVSQIPVSNEGNLYGERTPEEKLRMAQANQDAQITSPSSNGNATSTAGGGTPSPADVNQRKGINWEGIGSNAVNYGLPILQTAIGLKKLKELGKRPKDTLDPQYLQAIAKTSGDVQTARENAKYGYTGEELAALNQENTGLTNAGRAFARNVAGGSSAAGLNAERSVLNDAFGRKLQSRISDNALRLQKQDQAMARQQDLNAMLAHKQELNRRLFSDTLAGWQQDQAGAGQLVNAGLSNAIDSMKYNNFRKSYDEAQNKYQF